MTRRLGVGMVGYAFMGKAHSQAWRNVGRVFSLDLAPEMVALCGRNAAQVSAAARQLGWDSYETDWKALIARDDVDLVDICTPGSSHADIAVAALDAGKHVLCEKPLANTVAEARTMAAAADRARSRGVRAMVGFNYRRVPAAGLARQLIADGRLGTLRHVRATYLQDWIVDPEFPLVWRLQKDQAGSGALGDIGAHIVDLAQWIVGDAITRVSALTETFVRERPLGERGDGLAASSGGSGERGPVTVDDAALFLARFGGGPVATFEATRFATGNKNALRIEVNGERGSLSFDLETMNELWLYEDEGSTTSGFKRILVTEPDHPYMAAWWPPGHVLGYEHTFTHELRDLLTAIAEDADPAPGFADGLAVQEVLAAVQSSAATGAWTEVGTAG